MSSASKEMMYSVREAPETRLAERRNLPFSASKAGAAKEQF